MVYVSSFVYIRWKTGTKVGTSWLLWLKRLREKTLYCNVNEKEISFPYFFSFRVRFFFFWWQKEKKMKVVFVLSICVAVCLGQTSCSFYSGDCAGCVSYTKQIPVLISIYRFHFPWTHVITVATERARVLLIVPPPPHSEFEHVLAMITTTALRV